MLRRHVVSAYRLARQFGLDPRATASALKNVGNYLKESRRFRTMSLGSSVALPVGTPYPCLSDRDDQSGTASGHYFHQDLLTAQRIFERQPKRHIDVGSRVDGFVAHVAAFRQLEVVDIRPLRLRVQNIRFVQADITRLPPDLVECTDSLSCLHALEHFGLGRYGDPLDPEGHIKGLDSLCRMLRSGGVLYLSVPFGHPRVEFNAHRVFALRYLDQLFAGRLAVETFSYVDDAGDLHRNVQLSEAEIAANSGCSYGCAIYELRKP